MKNAAATMASAAIVSNIQSLLNFVLIHQTVDSLRLKRNAFFGSSKRNARGWADSASHVPSHVASTLDVSANLFICNDSGFEIALPNKKLLSAVVAGQYQHFTSICFLYLRHVG